MKTKYGLMILKVGTPIIFKIEKGFIYRFDNRLRLWLQTDQLVSFVEKMRYSALGTKTFDSAEDLKKWILSPCFKSYLNEKGIDTSKTSV